MNLKQENELLEVLIRIANAVEQIADDLDAITDDGFRLSTQGALGVTVIGTVEVSTY